MDARTFAPGVLDGHESIKGYRVFATDGAGGDVSWASYEAPLDEDHVVQMLYAAEQAWTITD